MARTERIGFAGDDGPAGAAGPTGPSGPGLELNATGGVVCTGATSGNVDVLVYTVPASPSGNGRCVLTGLILRLGTALVGAGSVTMTAGTSAGASDLIAAQVINSGTAVGVVYGLDLASLGASFDAGKGYNATLAAGATVYVRLAASGTVTTAPVLTAHAYGMAV